MPRSFGLFAIGFLVFVVGWILGGITSPPQLSSPDSILGASSETTAKGIVHEAVLYAEQKRSRYVVSLTLISRDPKTGKSKVIPLGSIAEARTLPQAKTWLPIEFRKDGLHAGGYFLDRSQLNRMAP